MSDLANWKLRGLVHTVRTEFAEWDLTNEDWQTPRQSTITTFLPDGRLSETENHNADGSTFRSTYSYDPQGKLADVRFTSTSGQSGKTTYHYDDLGRLSRVSHLQDDGAGYTSDGWTYEPDGGKTKTYTVPPLPPDTSFSYRIESTELSYSAQGAATIVTLYDTAGRPYEALFQDAEQRPLQRVIFERDSAGRLVRESLDRLAPFAPGVPVDLLQTTTTYTYDPDGRVHERVTHMGPIGENRITFDYDDHANVVRQVSEDIQREMQLHEDGHMEVVKENSHRHETRLDYVYDSHGNWTEKVVSGRLEPNPNFQLSNIERRAIEYYAQ